MPTFINPIFIIISKKWEISVDSMVNRNKGKHLVVDKHLFRNASSRVGRSKMNAGHCRSVFMVKSISGTPENGMGEINRQKQ